MRGIKFTAKEKLKALAAWGGKTEDAFRFSKKFKCTERSLWRWKALYDGTLESLENKSSRPHTPHPNAHTAEERGQIESMLAENPNMGYSELYGELRTRFAYRRHFKSMCGFIRKNCIRPAQVYEKHELQEYDTPFMLGAKMQMDVKYVPRECYTMADMSEKRTRFFQYTIIDEATRERFIYPYSEQTAYATCDFLKRAIIYFGYVPSCIQTDNGGEFTNPRGEKCTKIHIVDKLMNQLHIHHQLIRSYTPRHNGKVERSHRNDQARFYNFMKFDNLDDLRSQMKSYLDRSNNIPTSALRDRNGKQTWQTPLEKRAELLELLKEPENIYKVRFLKKTTRTA